MTTPSPQVRVGFLGAGNIAVDHGAAVSALGHTVIAGCATSQSSPRWQRFKELAPDARFMPSIPSLLQSPDVDAVVACLPWNVTQSWLPQLLATPKPVLIEKPVALSSNTLESALAASDARPGNKVVGLNRRFYTTVQKLKERCDEGGVKSAEIVISETVGRLSAIFGPEIVPHIPVYNSCHILDTAVHILGRLHPVRTYTYEERGELAPYRSLTGLLETDDGIPVSLVATAENPLPVGIRVLFDDRTTWRLSPMERLVAYKGYEAMEPSPGSNIRKYVPQSFLELAEAGAFKPGFLKQMKAFLEGQEREISATLYQQLELLRFIESIYDAPFSKQTPPAAVAVPQEGLVT